MSLRFHNARALIHHASFEVKRAGNPELCSRLLSSARRSLMFHLKSKRRGYPTAGPEDAAVEAGYAAGRAAQCAYAVMERAGTIKRRGDFYIGHAKRRRR